jgi:hypothetical protein
MAAIDLHRPALPFPIGVLGGVQRQLVYDDADLLGRLAAHRQRLGDDIATQPRTFGDGWTKLMQERR